MRLINVEAFLERQGFIRDGKRADRHIKVLESKDDEETEYVILSHRWIEEEVDYNEMVKLAKMDREEQDGFSNRTNSTRASVSSSIVYYNPIMRIYKQSDVEHLPCPLGSTPGDRGE